MVTAILIPIICIYFYWISKNELRENEAKWLALNELQEEAIVTGIIINIEESKMRYYYHRYIHVINILLQTETKTIHVKRVTPYLKQINSLKFNVGDRVRLYGNWQENEFRFLRFDVLKSNKRS